MVKLRNLALYGLGIAGGYAVWREFDRSRIRAANASLTRGKRILIVGAGFAGRNVALELVKLLPEPEDGEIILVDQNPFLLFTPMLTEAAGGELEAHHIVSPAMHLPPRIRFEQGRVDTIDLKGKSVTMTIGDQTQGVPEAQRTLAGDQLILALGSVTNYHGIPGLEEHSLPLKNLQDAAAVRSRVLALLERADQEPDAEVRRGLLTVVVGGGGFTGVEAMAAINDLVRDLDGKYPGVKPDDVRTILATPGPKLLPELDPALAAYAQSKLEERGIEVMLNTKITGAGEGYVELEGNRKIPSRLVVWAGGVKPSSAVETIDCKRGHHGGIVVDRTCAVSDHPGVWALGDCAEVPLPDGRGAYAPTAQNATREGTLVGRNVVAALRGEPPQPFTFTPLGELAIVGRRSGVARVFNHNFSGPVAWAMWRLIYLMKMPDRGQQARILLDWVLDVVFGRNMVGASVVTGPAMTAPAGPGSATSQNNHP
ncbi:MAG TPA: NAD(P)/FAD-dependent oxidoreductase [Chthoniobacterales bacterium]